jgi:phosphoglycerate dehydrogenase-like enzyme
MMPSGGVFVSAGRGDVVDEYGLINVLRDGSLQAALDVYEKEPLPLDSPLRGMKNVFLTPHIAGPTTDERALCGKAAMMNVAAYLQDRPVENIIRPEKYDRMSKL